LIELVAIGLLAGFLSGLFGIGGGMITVPLLLYSGLDIKSAVGISSMQMVFSSFVGSIRNIRQGKLDVKHYAPFGLGAVLGGALGGYFLDLFVERTIEFLLLGLITFALLRLFWSVRQGAEKQTIHPLGALFIGVGIGSIAGLLGVGGSVILIPILVGFFSYTSKEAAIIGLYFVTFSSLAAFITLSNLGYIDYTKGFVVAFAAILGVRLGQFISDLVSHKHHKMLLILMYTILFILVGNKVFIE